MGNRGISHLFQGNKGTSLKLKGTGEQRLFWGTGNIENEDFDFGEQGKMPIFSGEQGDMYPHGRAFLVDILSIHKICFVLKIKIKSTENK